MNLKPICLYQFPRPLPGSNQVNREMPGELSACSVSALCSQASSSSALFPHRKLFPLPSHGVCRGASESNACLVQHIHNTLALWPVCTHMDVCPEEFGVPRAHVLCVCCMCKGCLFVLGTYLIDVPHTCAPGEHTGSSLLCVHVLSTVGAVCMRVLCGRCVHIAGVCMRAGTHMVRGARTCF